MLQTRNRVTFPDFLCQHVDEADAFLDRTLVEGVGRQVAVKVSGPQVRNHFRRRNNADLDVHIRSSPNSAT